MDLVDIYKLMKILLIISTIFATFSVSANPKVYFINLEDGDRVESPFLIQFGLSGMGIAPAGTDRSNTGHHHLLLLKNTDRLHKICQSLGLFCTQLHQEVQQLLFRMTKKTTI